MFRFASLAAGSKVCYRSETKYVLKLLVWPGLRRISVWNSLLSRSFHRIRPKKYFNLICKPVVKFSNPSIPIPTLIWVFFFWYLRSKPIKLVKCCEMSFMSSARNRYQLCRCWLRPLKKFWGSSSLAAGQQGWAVNRGLIHRASEVLRNLHLCLC